MAFTPAEKQRRYREKRKAADQTNPDAIVRELVPAAVIGILVNPKSPELAPQQKEIEAAARTLGQDIQIVNASIDPDFDHAFTALVERRAGALIISTDPFFNSAL